MYPAGPFRRHPGRNVWGPRQFPFPDSLDLRPSESDSRPPAARWFIAFHICRDRRRLHQIVNDTRARFGSLSTPEGLGDAAATSGSRRNSPPPLRPKPSCSRHDDGDENQAVRPACAPPAAPADVTSQRGSGTGDSSSWNSGTFPGRLGRNLGPRQVSFRIA